MGIKNEYKLLFGLAAGYYYNQKSRSNSRNLNSRTINAKKEVRSIADQKEKEAEEWLNTIIQKVQNGQLNEFTQQQESTIFNIIENLEEAKNSIMNVSKSLYEGKINDQEAKGYMNEAETFLNEQKNRINNVLKGLYGNQYNDVKKLFDLVLEAVQLRIQNTLQLLENELDEKIETLGDLDDEYYIEEGKIKSLDLYKVDINEDIKVWTEVKTSFKKDSDWVAICEYDKPVKDNLLRWGYVDTDGVAILNQDKKNIYSGQWYTIYFLKDNSYEKIIDRIDVRF